MRIDFGEIQGQGDHALFVFVQAFAQHVQPLTDALDQGAARLLARRLLQVEEFEWWRAIVVEPPKENERSPHEAACSDRMPRSGTKCSSAGASFSSPVPPSLQGCEANEECRKKKRPLAQRERKPTRAPSESAREHGVDSVGIEVLRCRRPEARDEENQERRRADDHPQARPSRPVSRKGRCEVRVGAPTHRARVYLSPRGMKARNRHGIVSG